MCRGCGEDEENYKFGVYGKLSFAAESHVLHTLSRE